MVAAHNDVRASVGGGPMTWNSALAATAQAWAAACVDNEEPIGLIDHNPNRSDGHPYYVGENISGSGGAITGPGAVALWASEAADYDYQSNSCGAVCGHYSQVVWEASVEVGCGVAVCPLEFGTSVVCNYGPGGNVDGQRPY
jgi:pathogenesis-related protein 1